MKKLLPLFFLLIISLCVTAQTGSIITYDYSNPVRGISPLTQVIPFDRPFTLLVTKFPNSKVRKVYLYEIFYVKGKRILNRVLNPGNFVLDSTSLMKAATNHLSLKEQEKLADYLTKNKHKLRPQYLKAVSENMISVQELHKLIQDHPGNYTNTSDTSLKFSVSKDSLSIYFLPLRPSKYFDIEVNTGLNTANFQLVLQLNKALLKKDTTSWMSDYSKLQEATKQVDYESQRKAAVYTMNFDYPSYSSEFVNQGWDKLYEKLLEKNIQPADTLPDTNLLRTVNQKMKLNGINFDKMYYAVKISLDTNLLPVLQGLLPANYDASTDKKNYFDFQDRINNLDSSRVYFDSVSVALGKLMLWTNGLENLKILNVFKHLSTLCSSNEKALKTNFIKLQTSIESCELLGQSYMFGNDNRPVDLKTKSFFCMTTDLGITNIFARDYRNKINYIPKLFFGVNIYFRQVDKNARFNNLKWKWRETGLLSSRNPLQYFSLSLGLTIGSISNGNFSNLYNSFSLTAGPSIRLSKAFRFTGGLAFLDRTRANPLIASKQFITGMFASFSVDVDFLTPVQKLTDLLFK